MSKHKYAFNGIDENMARSVGINLGISTKQSIEVCTHIRGLPTEKAKTILREAASLKKAIPFRRFCEGAGHRKGKMGPGKFAPTTCNAILKIIESAEANAQFRGINSSNLVLRHICAHRGAGRWRFGRKARQKMKATHIEVVVEEKKQAKKDAEMKAPPKGKETPKKPSEVKK